MKTPFAFRKVPSADGLFVTAFRLFHWRTIFSISTLENSYGKKKVEIGE
jgi:hypothetical protein